MARTRNKSIRRLLGSVVMVANSFAVFCATIAGAGFQVAAPATVWLVGLIFTFVLLGTPAVLGKPGSYWFGSVLQFGVLLTGIWLPAMWFIGALCACMWAWAMIAGNTIDKAKAAIEKVQMGQTEVVEVFEVKEVK
ncbi:MAG: DUF4233 domain-containing protein [Micrococcales bacterium]